MRQFSIKDLERFSGIKAHTIRIWENRYGLLTPQRSSGNIRMYAPEDIRLLLLISLLLENGFKISQLAKLTEQDLSVKTNHLLTDNAKHHKVIYSLIVCMYASDTEGFETQLDNATGTYGIDTTIKCIIIPFLEKVELLSYKDTSIEAHFAVTAVRKKLIRGIETIKPPVKRPGTALLFLPKGEHYDLLLLYISYILKETGLRLLYLGTNISEDNLQKAILDKKPDQIFTYLSSKYTFNTTPLTSFLEQHAPKASLFIAEEEYVDRKKGKDNIQFFYFKHIESLVETLLSNTVF